ncbi:MAG: hypothetical protein ACMUIP_16815 [bacterium]
MAKACPNSCNKIENNTTATHITRPTVIPNEDPKKMVIKKNEAFNLTDIPKREKDILKPSD